MDEDYQELTVLDAVAILKAIYDEHGDIPFFNEHDHLGDLPYRFIGVDMHGRKKVIFEYNCRSKWTYRLNPKTGKVERWVPPPKVDGNWSEV